MLGYSQGGAVVQQLALDTPAKVDRLILSNTYAYNMASFREKLEGRLVPLFIRLFGMRLFAKLIVSLGLKQVPKEWREQAGRILGQFAEQDPKIMAALWKEAMIFDSRARLREIKCPTLIIAGSKDTAVPIHHSKMLHEGIAGSKLLVVQGADHALLWAHPDALVQAVDTFLKC